jgi:hypothetical protein
VNWSAAEVALVPPVFDTVILTVPAEPAGDVAVIWDAELTVYAAAAVLPNITLETPLNSVPEIVTLVPPARGPPVGLTDVMAGAAVVVVPPESDSLWEEGTLGGRGMAVVTIVVGTAGVVTSLETSVIGICLMRVVSVTGVGIVVGTVAGISTASGLPSSPKSLLDTMETIRDGMDPTVWIISTAISNTPYTKSPSPEFDESTPVAAAGTTMRADIAIHTTMQTARE